MERSIIKTGLKNTLFVVLAQSISFLLGIGKALVLPIVLGVTSFGYWQIYLLYISYAGIFALGFNDGIYLRYGKYNYEDLPRDLFRSSIQVFVVFQIFIMATVMFSVLTFEHNPCKQIAMFWASINIPITGLTGVLIYILQITNQLKKYSFFTILDKIILLIIILFIFVFQTSDFMLIVFADTFSKVLVLSILAYSCKDLIFGAGCNVLVASKEVLTNINVGIKLMLANFTGMLILGFGRFIVERFESVETYGTYAFAFSTINLFLIFITAVGLVIYPTLNRVPSHRYANYFTYLNQILVIMTFAFLLLYFPLKLFITKYMIEYVQIFQYLPVIFAIVFIQTKMQIIINPFYKLLREEKTMLKANIGCLIMAILLILPMYYIYHSVLTVAIGTYIAMFFRLYLSEIYLKKALKTAMLFKNIVTENIGILLFILFSYQHNLYIGFIGYAILFSTYVIHHRNTINNLYGYLSKG